MSDSRLEWSQYPQMVRLTTHRGDSYIDESNEGVVLSYERRSAKSFKFDLVAVNLREDVLDSVEIDFDEDTNNLSKEIELYESENDDNLKSNATFEKKDKGTEYIVEDGFLYCDRIVYEIVNETSLYYFCKFDSYMGGAYSADDIEIVEDAGFHEETVAVSRSGRDLRDNEDKAKEEESKSSNDSFLFNMNSLIDLFSPKKDK